ncbi:MAG TPA: dienelactone hydrolase family protein, partial [Planctomycetota bacterium]
MRHLTILALLAGCSTPSTSGPVRIEEKEVEYAQGDVALRGFLAWNGAQSGKRPGILVTHEWRGHNEYVRTRARALAAEGYVVFALDMYGKGVYAADHKEAAERAGVFKKDRSLMRGRARAGYDILAKHPAVDASKIVALGYCFGGTTSLELARSGAPLAGVASFHGDLSTPNPADAANIKGKVIAFHGAEDPHYKDDHVVAFMNEMRGAKVDYQVVFLGGAVHSFTVTDAGNDPSKGSAYDAKADARSWRMLLAFLKET